ncbi:MAG TPA: hypothetical protein VMW27_07710 [Thermoanaerobaculia bacterium]|nr:hypothetical protein [Thermoanaerobaculia bacterium]
MNRKSCTFALLLLTLIVPAAFAAEAPSPAATQEATLLAAWEEIFAAPALPSEPVEPAAPQPLAALLGVACCKPSPTCCTTAASVQACEDAGGTAYSTRQQCALNCC